MTHLLIKHLHPPKKFVAKISDASSGPLFSLFYRNDYTMLHPGNAAMFESVEPQDCEKTFSHRSWPEYLGLSSFNHY